MNLRAMKITGLFCLALAFLVSVPQSAFASGDIKGGFTGKVMCRDGKKQAEFKAAGTQSLSYSSAADIKRRIETLSWPSSGDTMGFGAREDEKVSLQHALSLLKKLSCDEDNAPPPPPEDVKELRGTGPQAGPAPPERAPAE